MSAQPQRLDGMPAWAASAAPTHAFEADDAAVAGLVYVSDEMPGWRRVRRGQGFAYLKPTGESVREKAHLHRIRALAIPPAYTEVWICPLAQGHLQATGRDARGRKQYRYHEQWEAVRDEQKFERMLEFGRSLPRLRRRIARDLARTGHDRAKVVAAVVHLLDVTALRVGNAEYARTNGSYGLTTLKNRHVRARAEGVEFSFRGKSGVVHKASLSDPRIARIVRRCQELPGQDLFQYLDDEGQARQVRSEDVNAYLRELMGPGFSAKDFRTWHASTMSLEMLTRCARAQEAGASGTRQQVLQALRCVAASLGNTLSVCRKAYVHPLVVECFLHGEITQERPQSGMPTRGLRAAERALLALLEDAA